MMRLFVFVFFVLTLGCESEAPVTAAPDYGEVIASKSCSGQAGAGYISVHQKSAAGASGGAGPVTITGSGFNSKIQGCPSSVSFECPASAGTAARFGTNVTGNEIYRCTGGTVNFTPVYSSQPSYNTYNTYNTVGSPYSSPASASQYSSEIMPGSQVYFLAAGPGKNIIRGHISFKITAGRTVPLPCQISFACE